MARKNPDQITRKVELDKNQASATQAALDAEAEVVALRKEAVPNTEHKRAIQQKDAEVNAAKQDAQTAQAELNRWPTVNGNKLSQNDVDTFLQNMLKFSNQTLVKAEHVRTCEALESAQAPATLTLADGNVLDQTILKKMELEVFIGRAVGHKVTTDSFEEVFPKAYVEPIVKLGCTSDHKVQEWAQSIDFGKSVNMGHLCNTVQGEAIDYTVELSH